MTNEQQHAYQIVKLLNSDRFDDIVEYFEDYPGSSQISTVKRALFNRLARFRKDWFGSTANRQKFRTFVSMYVLSHLGERVFEYPDGGSLSAPLDCTDCNDESSEEGSDGRFSKGEMD